MSTGVPSRFGSDRWLSPTTKFMLLTWVLLLGGGWIVVTWMDKSSKSVWDNPAATKDSVREMSDEAKMNKVEELRRNAEAASARLESLERALAAEKLSARPVIDTAPSVQAVERAKVLALAGQLTSIREKLLKLKALQATWQAQSASISTGDLGRRIAASPSHLELAVDLMETERTSPEKIQEWEGRLATLAEPVENAAHNEKSRIGITVEHAQQLTELNLQVVEATKLFEEPQFLLEAITKETSGVAPHAQNFDEVVKERRMTSATALAKRLNAARTDARNEAEKAHREPVTQLEEELVQAKTKLQEQKTQTEKDQFDTLAKSERDQIVEETRVKEAQRRATIAGLKEEAIRLDEALRVAQLEREFERDMPKIRSYLSALTAEAFSLRANATKGPASLSLIKGSGALDSTHASMRKFIELVLFPRDRPRGALPDSSSFIVEGAGVESVATAQALLLKYGDLMVERKLLAP